MTLLEQTLHLCKLYKITPNKLLGQNFLIDETVLDGIIDNVLKIKAERGIKKFNILEIGGGFGVLTNRLVEIADKVFLVEKDDQLMAGLQKIEKSFPGRLKVVLDDALNLKYEKEDKIKNEKLKIKNKEADIEEKLLIEKVSEFFNGEEYFVVANIPYSITSHLIRILLESGYSPKEIVIMIQKEVAERICAKDGDDSVLSLSAKFYCDPTTLFIVKSESFYPSPAVDSAIIRLSKKEESIIEDRKDIDNFFRFIRSGFSNKRKMLYHNLFSVYRLDKENVKSLLIKSNLSDKIRAQDLSLDDWLRLWYNFNKV